MSTVAPDDERPLARGARGGEVREVQNQLLRAGYSLQRFGADGDFGSETANAVVRFQKAHALPQTGVVDGFTRQALEAAPSPRPNVDALWSDGVLRGVLALGFDEVGSHLAEAQELEVGLRSRGFRDVTAEERAQLGLVGGRFVTRTFERAGEPARVVLEVVTPDMVDAKERFAAALRSQELVLYGGHGRYGSGPDFDDIHSPLGNFVVGQPFEAGHVTLGANDLGAAALTSDYQFMFFDGCNTFRYFDDFRARARGKTSANLDLVGSNTELYWNVTAANLFAALDSVTAGEDLERLGARLDAINGPGVQGHAFRGDGFEDN